MTEFIFFRLYRFLLVPTAWLLLQFFYVLLPKKLQTVVKLKNKSRQDLMRFETKTEASTWLWFHAASGELEYARPVMRLLKQTNPQIKILLTYNSPSALRIIEKCPEVDFALIAPWEFKSDLQTLIDRFQPAALLVARTDLWPMMAWCTKKNNIPLLIFAATMSLKSSRRSGLGRALNSFAFQCADEVHVVSEQDQKLIYELAPRVSIKIKGDTRYDQVFYRLSHASTLNQNCKPLSTEKVFIAGSTWPQDESVLLKALPQIVQNGWKVLLAPHEVHEEKIRTLQKEIQSLQLTSQRYTEAKPWKASLLILDQVGQLAEVYTWGQLAFVGGSFKSHIHSVMEPLAAGLPVLFGPHHMNNREALEFLQASQTQGQKFVGEVKNSEDLIRNILDFPTGFASRENLEKALRQKQGASTAVLEWLKRKNIL